MQKIEFDEQFLSYGEQFQLLKKRGMNFSSEEKAKRLLKQIGYYRLSSYWHPFFEDKQEKIFKNNTQFEKVYDLYKFDKELRKFVLGELEQIEINIRSKMIYILSTEHNPFWLSDEVLFINKNTHTNLICKIKMEVDRSDEHFILSFKSKFSNEIPPSFITLEILSFGTVSKIYSYLKRNRTKKDIASEFALPDVVFESWLHSLVYIRNLSAHHARLWNRIFSVKPLLPKSTSGIWLSSGEVSNNRLFFFLSIILYLSNAIEPKNTLKQDLYNLFNKYPNIDKAAMGFPIDWQKEVLWAFPTPIPPYALTLRNLI
ncbi:MAG: Abi family protein [Fibromonadaceae bacterium]|nr:Abi family protein [Fibromonadaceae bacterium]